MDGFNLYFGLRTLNSKYKWLDLMALCEVLCRPGQEVGEVKYFTSRITGADPAKTKRQSIYLEALASTGVNIIYGKFQTKKMKCQSCRVTSIRHEEKESDVNLASCLLVDAVEGIADHYLVISGDSDLISPMELARDRYGRDVIPIFPPNRHSSEIKRRMHKHIPLSEASIRQSQLPRVITKDDGYVLCRPEEW